MEYSQPIEQYPGKIREVVLGKEGKTAKVGGENTLPLHFFEGSLPNPVRFALEVYDMEPEGWAPWVVEPFKDVLIDPVRWAIKCVNEFLADIIFLQLISTSPSGKNASPEEAARTVKNVAEAVFAPVIVYGSGDATKDVLVLTKVAEACAGMNLFLGPVTKDNYKEIVKAASEYGHGIVAQSLLDINLTKELNIKICQTFSPDKILIDPLSAALGYGLEYSFSTMERIKQAAVIHNDEMLQMPIIANVASDVWKTKEAKENEEQAIMWEVITAVSLLIAGANILVLRHPKTLRLIKEVIRL